jgi:hypothetical protein
LKTGAFSIGYLIRDITWTELSEGESEALEEYK